MGSAFSSVTSSPSRNEIISDVERTVVSLIHSNLSQQDQYFRYLIPRACSYKSFVGEGNGGGEEDRAAGEQKGRIQQMPV